MEKNYKIIYAKRKTVSMKIENDGTLTIRAPKGMKQSEIEELIIRHSPSLERIRTRVAARERAISSADPAELEKILRDIALPMMEKYSDLMGRAPGKVTFTNAKTRFGSCSGKGNICFSRYLALHHPAAIEYVVVHELAHLFEMNHSRRFYAIVEKHLPDWRRRKALLRYPTDASQIK